MGKRKIPIERIEKKSTRDVTFTKRRKGLFHKAMELSVLCDAKIAIVVFSPAGNAFSYGHPSVDELVNHYRNQTRPPISTGSITEDALTNSIHATKCGIKAEKERLQKIINEEGGYWWDRKNIDEIYSVAELQHIYTRLREKVQRRLDQNSLPNNMSSTAGHIDQKLLMGGEGNCQVPMYLSNEANGQNHVEKGDLYRDGHDNYGEEIAPLVGDNPCDSLVQRRLDQISLPSKMSSTAGHADQKLLMGGESSWQVPMYLSNEALVQNHVEKGDLYWDGYDNYDDEEIAALARFNPCDSLFSFYNDFGPSTTMETTHSAYHQAWSC